MLYLFFADNLSRHWLWKSGIEEEEEKPPPKYLEILSRSFRFKCQIRSHFVGYICLSIRRASLCEEGWKPVWYSRKNVHVCQSDKNDASSALYKKNEMLWKRGSKIARLFIFIIHSPLLFYSEYQTKQISIYVRWSSSSPYDSTAALVIKVLSSRSQISVVAMMIIHLAEFSWKMQINWKRCCGIRIFIPAGADFFFGSH